MGAEPGGQADLSVDLEARGGNRNFLQAADRAWALHQLALRKPMMLGLSPPCTMYSALMRMWNDHRMEPMTLAVRRAESDVLLEFAMICAKGQLFAGRRFYFEHPQTATSWTRAAVVHVLSLPGVFSVDFHQCAFGLKSPLGMPIRKATRLLTNSSGIRARFEGKLCTCTVPHRRVEGSEGDIV